ncbi:hypothetical protein BpHYR1_007514 [Brachionus plicatilis]|uniref:Uncharacterized protein n=1 Tax=Brachionus plicatilis TaxID=10195 RepID=A0A3M7PHF3_BRAPC|nr:hypothetical protein BpHYR1_007514 [Brachionus plicatilis]
MNEILLKSQLFCYINELTFLRHLEVEDQFKISFQFKEEFILEFFISKIDLFYKYFWKKINFNIKQ